MANRHEEGCSSSNVMKEMQIKAVMTPHYITGMAKIPNIDNTKSGGCEAVLIHCWRECKTLWSLWKTVCHFLEN